MGVVCGIFMFVMFFRERKDTLVFMDFNLISKSKRVPMMSRIAAQEVRMQASPMETESLDAWEITGAIKEDVYRIDMCMFDCGFIVLYEMIMLHLYILYIYLIIPLRLPCCSFCLCSCCFIQAPWRSQWCWVLSEHGVIPLDIQWWVDSDGLPLSLTKRP